MIRVYILTPLGTNIHYWYDILTIHRRGGVDSSSNSSSDKDYLEMVVH